MVDDTPEVTALKSEKAKSDAQRDVAKAKLEQLQAELALAEARANPAVAGKATIEAETALQALRKAQAEARVAAINAEAGTMKALAGSVSGSSLTGTVTAQQGAGGIEASLLAAKAINDAVVQIKRRLPKLQPGRRYILFAGSQRPSFADWHLFQFRHAGVLHAYDRAATLKRAAEAAAGDGALPSQETKTGLESAAMAASAAGAALDIASKLGSYFQSDYTVGPVALAGVDTDLVAVALAGLLPGAWYPARWSLPVPGNLAEMLLAELFTRHDAAAVNCRTLEAKRKAMTAAAAVAGLDAAQKGELEKLATQFTEAADAYAAADKAFEAFLENLATPDANGMPLVTRIAEQKAVAEGLAQGDIALLVQFGGGAGTFYTKKNLWTFFWGMPFFVSGGAIVSFLAMGGDGAVKVGGQVPLHSGFVRIGDIPNLITPPFSRLRCMPSE